MIQIFVKKNYLKQWALWWWLWWCGITVQWQEDGGRKMKMSSQAALQDMSKLDHVRLKGSLKMFVSWNQKDSKYLNIGTVQHCTLLGHLCKTLVGVCSVVIFPQILNIIALGLLHNEWQKCVRITLSVVNEVMKIITLQ